jgi:DNA repair exonuclease SbcCD nuclease subunit
MVRFLHLADLHLGSQLPASFSNGTVGDDILKTADRRAVERLIDIAIDEEVDFLVIAGDLYDNDARSVQANTFLAEQFERLDDIGIPVYLIYGNHDPVGRATTYVDLPQNVHEFDDEEAEEVAFPDESAPEAYIWGQSYTTRHESRSMYSRFTPTDDSVPTIGVLHTGLDPDNQRYVPVARSNLEGKEGIHYWALGHIHDPRVYTVNQPVAFPGIPQGRQANESGLGGGYLVELTTDDVSMEFVPTSPVVWQTIDVDVSELDSPTVADVKREMINAADRIAPPDPFEGTPVTVRGPDHARSIEGYVCRWRLTGNGSAHETLSGDEEVLVTLEEQLRQDLSGREPGIWTESVRDETGPAIPDVEELRDEDRVIDETLTMFDEYDQETLRERFADTDVVGLAWEPTTDHEAVEPDELALTDEKIDELIDRAQQQVLEELALGRMD